MPTKWTELQCDAFSIQLVIDRRLHSHNKGHWRAKAEPVKQARSSAAALAKRAGVKLTGPVVVDYHFVMPDRRRRDVANLVQSCKPFIDGVIDVGGISGDHWEVLSIGRVSCEVATVLGNVEKNVVVVLRFRSV